MVKIFQKIVVRVGFLDFYENIVTLRVHLWCLNQKATLFLEICLPCGKWFKFKYSYKNVPNIVVRTLMFLLQFLFRVGSHVVWTALEMVVTVVPSPGIAIINSAIWRKEFLTRRREMDIFLAQLLVSMQQQALIRDYSEISSESNSLLMMKTTRTENEYLPAEQLHNEFLKLWTIILVSWFGPLFVNLTVLQLVLFNKKFKNSFKI